MIGVIITILLPVGVCASSELTGDRDCTLAYSTAMKNQTDRFYRAAIVFAGRSVYTTLFEPPLPSIQWLSLVRESDTECWTCSIGV